MVANAGTLKMTALVLVEEMLPNVKTEEFVEMVETVEIGLLVEIVEMLAIMKTEKVVEMMAAVLEIALAVELVLQVELVEMLAIVKTEEVATEDIVAKWWGWFRHCRWFNWWRLKSWWDTVAPVKTLKLVASAWLQVPKPCGLIVLKVPAANVVLYVFSNLKMPKIQFPIFDQFLFHIIKPSPACQAPVRVLPTQRGSPPPSGLLLSLCGTTPKGPLPSPLTHPAGEKETIGMNEAAAQRGHA